MKRQRFTQTRSKANVGKNFFEKNERGAIETDERAVLEETAQLNQALSFDELTPPSRSMPEISNKFAQTTVPAQLTDRAKRLRWELPSPNEPNEFGPYIVELNVEHFAGLPGAKASFLAMYQKTTEQTGERSVSGRRRRPPLCLTKSYLRCDLSDNEWVQLVADDETRPKEERAIYRLWPDFPVEANIDRSISTIKADAALRAFDATGDGIVWAIVDSGIQADHPHFGSHDSELSCAVHRLYAKDVVGLHRCFAEVHVDDNGVDITDILQDPDLDPQLSEETRVEILDKHRRWALTDDFGHGTHVAGIITGKAPEADEICVFERKYIVDGDGNKVVQSFQKREITEKPDHPLRTIVHGVAPNCKLISLRVLDKNGKGRSSQVIQALEYIRERINDNPKLMRVHGVNLSLGYEFDAEMFACGQSPLCNAVDRLVQEGVIVVAAAGNTGFGTVAASVGASKVGLSNTINDPGNAALAITVGATHREAPYTYGVSFFSSKGPTADGRLKPDLVAPGERITSCAAGEKLQKALSCFKDVEEVGTISGGYYVDDSGTSMAAPHVSGAIAAFLSIRREFIGKPLDVKRIFLDSATSLGREHYFEGHGMVDLMRAIQKV